MKSGLESKGLRLKTLTFAGTIFVLMALIFLIEGCATMKNKDHINNISFSFDGKKILFSRQKGEGPAQIQVYNLETSVLSAYKSPDDELWSMARYSYDGSSIVFIIYPKVDKKLDLAGMQVAVMDSDGKNIKKVTNSPGVKIYPSFSHSGKKIIYAGADTIRESGKTRAADYDVYEVDVKTGRESRLTKFRFFQMSSLYYLPDDTSFIFFAEYPRACPENPDCGYDAMKKAQEDYKTRYKENNIFLMRPGEKNLRPYIEFYSYSSRPMLSADGSRLFFRGRGKPETGGGWEQFYLYSPDGNHRCLTNIISTSVWSGAVSPTGNLLAAVYDIAPEREKRKIVIYDVEGGSSREIVLPDQPSRIINGKP